MKEKVSLFKDQEKLNFTEKELGEIRNMVFRIDKIVEVIRISESNLKNINIKLKYC